MGRYDLKATIKQESSEVEMTNWIYDGYTKVHSADRRKMIETWIWKCDKCGYEIRVKFGNANKPNGDCPICAKITGGEME